MARIAPAIKRAATLYARRLKDPRAARAAMDRLIPDPAGTGATLADIVIEAISETRGQARAVSRAGTAHEARRGASHQYVQPVSGNAARGTGAARASGGHPLLQSVAKMPLVEVVHADGGRCAGARSVGQIDKLALPVKSAPGFLVNAVLAPYILQAMRSVDAASRRPRSTRPWWPSACRWDRWSWPTPWVWTSPAPPASWPAAGPPRCLADRLSRGQLGRKTGQGFYAGATASRQDKASAAPPASRPA